MTKTDVLFLTLIVVMGILIAVNLKTHDSVLKLEGFLTANPPIITQ